MVSPGAALALAVARLQAALSASAVPPTQAVHAAVPVGLTQCTDPALPRLPQLRRTALGVVKPAVPPPPDTVTAPSLPVAPPSPLPPPVALPPAEASLLAALPAPALQPAAAPSARAAANAIRKHGSSAEENLSIIICLTGFLGPDGAFSITHGSLLHSALVDVPSVQPASTLAARLRRRRSCGPEYGRLGDRRGEAAWGRGRAGRP